MGSNPTRGSNFNHRGNDNVDQQDPAVVAYTTNPILIVAAVLGAFVGTVLAVNMNKRKSTAAGVATDLVS